MQGKNAQAGNERGVSQSSCTAAWRCHAALGMNERKKSAQWGKPGRPFRSQLLCNCTLGLHPGVWTVQDGCTHLPIMTRRRQAPRPRQAGAFGRGGVRAAGSGQFAPTCLRGAVRRCGQGWWVHLAEAAGGRAMAHVPTGRWLRSSCIGPPPGWLCKANRCSATSLVELLRSARTALRNPPERELCGVSGAHPARCNSPSDAQAPQLHSWAAGSRETSRARSPQQPGPTVPPRSMQRLARALLQDSGELRPLADAG